MRSTSRLFAADPGLRNVHGALHSSPSITRWDRGVPDDLANADSQRLNEGHGLAFRHPRDRHPGHLQRPHRCDPDVAPLSVADGPRVQLILVRN